MTDHPFYPVQLLPCPFCGSPARTDLLPHVGSPGWVQCSKCELTQHMSDTLEEAVKRWNTRAALSQGGSTRVEAIEYIAEIVRLETQTTNSGIILNSTDVAKAILNRFPVLSQGGSSDQKSAPTVRSSLPSGESDPSVTLDWAGADTGIHTQVERSQAPPGHEWDLTALDLVNQIWAIPTDWPPTRRIAHAQCLILEALKASVFIKGER